MHEACPSVPIYTYSKGWLPADWKEDDRPAGDRTFYALARLPWNEVLELCEALEVRIEPRANSPGSFTLQHDGPLPHEATSLSYDCASYAEQCFVSAIDLYFANPRQAHRDPVALQDRHEFMKTPDPHFLEKPSHYTTKDKAQLELDPAGDVQGAEQMPMFIDSAAPAPF
ncbi:hypothetical protein ES705_47315 [subsurface metagenome]